MSLANFIANLFESGAVEVPPFTPGDEAELQAARAALVAGELVYRESLAEGTPAMEIEAAIWSAQQLYRAAQCLVFRDYDTGAVERELSGRPPQQDSPGAQYSVDVTMRFLPDLIRHASAVSKDDPLPATLHAWASDWPLSSVGLPLDRPPAGERIENLVSDRWLLTLYVDRIIARRDLSRLNHPAVREAVCAAIGIHPELAPEVHAALPADAFPWPLDQTGPSQGDTP